MKNHDFRRAVFLAALLFLAFCPVTAAAGPGEDTFVTIMVNGAPREMTVTLEFPEDAEQEPIVMEREDRVWETYFRVYFRGHLIKWRWGLPDSTQVAVKNGPESFVTSFPEGSRTGENAIFLLDVGSRSMEEGDPPFRTVFLIAMRIGITLLLQVLIFYLLGYRDRRSWLIFLLTVSVTQAVLQAFVLRGASTLSSDYVLWALVVLCLSEGFVTVVHTVLFSLLFWNHRERRAVWCAALCNVVTLAVGAVNVVFLPM